MGVCKLNKPGLSPEIKRCRGEGCPERSSCLRYLHLDEKMNWLEPAESLRESPDKCRFKIEER